MIQLIGFIQGKTLYLRGKRNYSDKIENYLVNGKKLKKTFDEYWFQASGIKLKTLSAKRSKPINTRFVLNTAELKHFPKEVLVEDCEPKYGGDYNDLLSFKYKDIEYDGRFYDKKNDYETYYDKVEFQIEILVSKTVFKEYKHPTLLPEFMLPREKNGDLIYTMKDTNHLVSRELVIYDNDIIISTQKSLLVSKPCKITKNYSYQIVRGYIRKHINRNFAYISSDYNFCLTVKKILKLDQSETHEIIGLLDGKSRGKKTFVNKEVEIFKTSPPEKNGSPYKGYPLIKPFEGKNINDLFEKIEVYLKDLMLLINEPLKECSKCKGTGAEPELKSLQVGK